MSKPDSITSNQFRLRASLLGGETCYTEACNILVQFVTAACKRYQVNLEPVDTPGHDTYQCDSVGIQVLLKRSDFGIYVELSTFLSQVTLSGRQRTTVFLSSTGLLDLLVETTHENKAQNSVGALPEFIANLALSPNVGLVELRSDYVITGRPLAIGTDAETLFSFISAEDRSLCVMVLGADSSITADALARLARQVTGTAHVTVLGSRQAATRFEEMTGPGWDIPPDCVRVFSPRIDFAGEPLRTSRLVAAGSDSPEDEGSEGLWDFEKVAELLAVASRFTGLSFSESPMISLEGAIAALAAGASSAGAVLKASSDIPPQVALANYERIVELQATIDELRQSVAVLAEEKAFESELAQSWKQTAETCRSELDRFQAANAYTEALSKVSSNWRSLIEGVLLEAVVATEQVETAEDLRESLAVVTAQNRSLNHREKPSSAAEERVELIPNDAINLAIVLSQHYPGRFALLGQGSRSYKATTQYHDQARFLLALDILGNDYYNWKMASEKDTLSLKECFEERCRHASFKTSPSATSQGLAFYPDEHTIRLADGVRRPMYELRDHGTTMEERHMLYIGFVWDERSCQIVLGTFSHPRVLSSHT